MPRGLDSVCVYCGSGLGGDPAIAAAAKFVGRALAENGIGLVYGGGSMGLMGEIARAVLASRGRVSGIIPQCLVERERPPPGLTELVVTRDMHERKLQMSARAEAFVMFPGGLGTLDETVEQLTWTQIGLHAKPTLILNLNGYWDPFIQMFNRMQQEGFVRPGLGVDLLVVDRAEDVLQALFENIVADWTGR